MKNMPSCFESPDWHPAWSSVWRNYDSAINDLTHYFLLFLLPSSFLWWISLLMLVQITTLFWCNLWSTQWSGLAVFWPVGSEFSTQLSVWATHHVRLGLCSQGCHTQLMWGTGTPWAVQVSCCSLPNVRCCISTGFKFSSKIRGFTGGGRHNIRWWS